MPMFTVTNPSYILETNEPVLRTQYLYHPCVLWHLVWELLYCDSMDRLLAEVNMLQVQFNQKLIQHLSMIEPELNKLG